MICVIRKVDLCQCGCRGQCTFDAIMKVIAWSMNVLATGRFPRRRHDGGVWGRATGEFAQGIVGAVMEYRADLLELVSALGFKQWSHNVKPCWCCNATKDNWFNFPLNVATSAWTRTTSAEYDRYVRSCLTRVRVESARTLRALIRALEFDTRPGADGYHGLALMQDFHDGAVHLARGNRRLVADGETVTDIHNLRHLQAPCELLFFNAKGDLCLNFVPLLFEIVGFHMGTITLDVMHVLDLGVLRTTY